MGRSQENGGTSARARARASNGFTECANGVYKIINKIITVMANKYMKAIYIYKSKAKRQMNNSTVSAE